MAKDPYRYFRIEARELVDALQRDALALERSPNDGAIVARMLRAAHTLKGAARVVRRTTVADLAHDLESALSPYRDGGSVEPATIGEVLRMVDAMSADVRALDASPAKPEPSGAAGAAIVEELHDSVRVDVSELDRLLRALYESGVRLAALRAQADALEASSRVAGIASDQLANSASDAQRVRQLVNDVGSSVARVRRAFRSGLDQLELELEQARETADRLRLLPAHAIVDVLERAVRDAAESLGKRAELRVRGADTRLDANVLFTIRAALLHIVRNAVAHGIEPPEQRRRSGKPPVGRIDLIVERRGGRVAFTCIDDGRGVDVEAVRGAALKRGLLAPEVLSAMPRERLMDLLLRGGTTTVATAGAVSGRGIGLDVVRDVVSKLKGDVELTSEPEIGTRIVITTPISLVSLTALIVGTAETLVAVPLQAVRTTLLIPRDKIASGAGESIEIEGRAVPLVPLRALLGAGPRDARRPQRSVTAVVVEAAGDRVAVGVERLLGTAPVIVRQLPESAQAAPIVAGATLDPEGMPQLVLDPMGIVAAAKTVRAAGASVRPRPSPILIIDDSLTTRMLEQSILESAGYDVELAASAEEGLEKARRGAFSLFLVDVEMPGMDGFEFVQHTRADPVLRNVPAILVTSRAAEEDRRRGAAAGAHAYVVKSEFDQGKLLEVIGELVA